jgi:probable phosphoglycerate mutase
MPRSASANLFPNPRDADSREAADWITAHCDGGARGNPGPAGFGAVLEDGKGQILAELSEFLGVRSNNVAEYEGLLACLNWAIEHHHTHLRVVSDSLLMVNQIQGSFKVKSPDLLPLWQQARSRIAQLQGFEIRHALRHKNKDADRLANDAMDRGTNTKPARSAQAPLRGQVRGQVRDGAVHLLGGATLPEGAIVKVIPE